MGSPVGKKIMNASVNPFLYSGLTGAESLEKSVSSLATAYAPKRVLVTLSGSRMLMVWMQPFPHSAVFAPQLIYIKRLDPSLPIWLAARVPA
jgi:hypothetical protein